MVQRAALATMGCMANTAFMTSKERERPAHHPGISAMSVYVPRFRVDLEQWCEWTGSDWIDEPDTGDPFAADEAPHGFFPFDDDSWQDADAFMPGWREGPGRPQFPPLYGGFPLLDDVTDGLEEEPI